MTEKIVPQTIKQLIKTANDKKAENVCCYDLTDQAWISEYVMIIGAKNNIHCKALLDEISLKFKKLNKNNVLSKDFYEIPKQSGKAESGWVILDLNSLICHFITQECREFYDIDRHFKDKTQVILH